jgi:hypothetical protein
VNARFRRNAHAVSHFGGNSILADNQPLVAEAAGFALNDKAPQRVARLLNQLLAKRITRRGERHRVFAALRAGAVVAGHGVKRAFERAAKPAERGRLLLRDFVIERAFGQCG